MRIQSNPETTRLHSGIEKPKAQKYMETKKNKLVSLVVPCHNEEASLPLLAKEINRVCSKIDESKPKAYRFEVILVDDGSTDGTLAKMRELSEEKLTPPQIFIPLFFS